MRLAAVAVIVALAGCPSGGGAGPSASGTFVAKAASGKKLYVDKAVSLETNPRDVPEDVVIQAMRSSSLFFEEDIRAFSKDIAEQLAKLDQSEFLLIETSDTSIRFYVLHDELQIVAFREGTEVSRHASAIPTAAVKTELAMKPKAPQKEVVVIHDTPAPPNNEQRARELTDAGQKQFQLTNYPGAIESWKQAYLLTSEPMLLFRIGEAYRAAGDCKEATRFYASYQQAAPNPANKTALDASLKACAPKGKVVTKQKAPPAQGKKLTEEEVRAKIAELDRLLGQGLITKDEYDLKKKALLDQM